MSASRTLLTVFVALACAVVCVQAHTYPYKTVDLKSMNLQVDATNISVSGISSGGYMAVQYHIAYSNHVIGAGIFAGGPWECAMNNVEFALHQCMKDPDLISLTTLYGITESAEAITNIDPLKFLQNDRVYLFSGTADDVVHPGVMHKLYTYYSQYVNDANIQTVFNISAAHGMVTNDYGNACSTFGSPFIQNCGYDGAGALLQHIYNGQLNAPVNLPNNLSNMFMFDQTEFVPLHLSSSVGLSKQGFVYVPTACWSQQAVCKLHVAFHGCEQEMQDVQDTYVVHAGYNKWAESNNIIVVYPQASKNSLNPKGCWDWWGYTGPLYSCHDGPQMKTVYNILSTIAGRQL